MADDFQYIKLPDGSYGKFSADATDDVIRAAVSKDFPDAFKQETAQGPASPMERFAEVTTGSRHPLQQLGSELSQFKSDPVGAATQTAKGVAMAIPNMVNNALFHPIDTIKGITGGDKFAEDFEQRKYGNMAADLLGGITNTLPLFHPAVSSEMAKVPGAVKAIPESMPTRAGIGEAIRQEGTGTISRPKGLLKPGVRAASELGGAALGGLTGLIEGGPWAGVVGAAGGGRYGPKIVDLFAPAHPRAFPLELPPEAKPIEYSPHKPSKGVLQGDYSKSGGEPGVPKGGAFRPASGRPQPTGAQLEMQRIAAEEKAAASKLVGPDSPSPSVKGSYWSMEEDALRKLANTDRDAAEIYATRFGTQNMPKNSRYLTDIGHKPNKGLYKSVYRSDK